MPRLGRCRAYDPSVRFRGRGGIRRPALAHAPAISTAGVLVGGCEWDRFCAGARRTLPARPILRQFLYRKGLPEEFASSQISSYVTLTFACLANHLQVALDRLPSGPRGDRPAQL